VVSRVPGRALAGTFYLSGPPFCGCPVIYRVLCSPGLRVHEKKRFTGQYPIKSWMETGTPDIPGEYNCNVAHALARYPGLTGEPERTWEVMDGKERGVYGRNRQTAGKARRVIPVADFFVIMKNISKLTFFHN
jgi:hypothetical protein